MKEKMLKILIRIFCLPPVLTLIIAVPSFGFVIAVLMGQIQSPVLAYMSYVLSAYALVISVTGILKVVTYLRKDFREHLWIKALLSKPVVEKFLSESRFRTEMALYPGFCINVVYAVFKTVMGICYRSAWFLSLGVYYLSLAVMRFLLIHYLRSQKEPADLKEAAPQKEAAPLNGELRRYRMCAYLLFVINAAFAGIAILAVKKNAGFRYPGYLIYVMAMYAFYSVITAVMNLVKYRKYGSPVMSAAKVINMSTALVSLFSLETAMLAQFGGENTESFRFVMTAFTGGGVSLIVLGMALYMIVRSGILLKKNMEEQNGTYFSGR